MSPAAERPRRRAQTWAFTLAFLGLAIGNATFAWVAAERARSNAAPGEEPDYGLAWGIAIGGGVAIVGLLVILVITLRHQRRLRAANQALAENEVRSQGLQEVAGRLARALASDDVVAALLDHLPAAVGGQGRRRRHRHRRRHARAAQPRPRRRARRRSRRRRRRRDRPRCSTDREPAWLQSPLGWRGDEAADLLADGGWAMAVLPLVADDVRGLLAVSYARVHTFVDEERAVLETVGVLAARAFARGRRYDAEHRASVAFQQTALPTELPEVDGLTIAARYRAGAAQAAVGRRLVRRPRPRRRPRGAARGRRGGPRHGGGGGDGPAAHRVPDDRAAAARAQRDGAGGEPAGGGDPQRHVLHGALRGDRALHRDDGLVPGRPPPTAARARRQGPRCSRRRASRRSAWRPRWPRPCTTSRWSPATSIVLYTDGVIERRKESIDQGFERLELVSADLADLEPEDFSDALLEALVPVEEQTDDVALLVVRYDGV